MKIPTHPPHYETDSTVSSDDIMQYLLENTDEERARKIAMELVTKEITVDGLLATLIYATAISLHANYSEQSDGEEICCRKSKVLTNYLHILVHGMFDFDRKTDG